jgi:alpha-galactosidase
MYREDFNCDPAGLWAVGDGKEEGQRDGITENLYIQGHYRLWDNIIAYCKRTNKLPFIDSCASGGGRNDLESMRRAVPFLRSDSDRTSTGLRLAMTTSFMQWIPCCGASTKETTEQLTAGKPDIYVLRASYLPIFNYSFEYTQDKDLDYDTLRQAQKEWMQVKKYFYDDFYILTPWHPEPETDKWTVYMFINPTTQEGVIQAFRQERCEEESVTVKVRGVEADKYYTITDVDGRNSVKSVKGSDLAKGFAITLPEKRMAAILFIAKEQ